MLRYPVGVSLVLWQICDIDFGLSSPKLAMPVLAYAN